MRRNAQLPIISVSFLVLGNCLGVGVLALPVKYGLAGFVPALAGIVLAWAVMLASAFIIAQKIGEARNDTFDIPWFYGRELGPAGKWLAIACNLVLLYGVLTAYLSGMATMVDHLFRLPVSKPAVTVLYFAVTTALVLFGGGIYRKGNVLVIVSVWICFALLVGSGSRRFDPGLLRAADWNCFPIGLPIAISAFHFHNLIPTVSRSLGHDRAATRKAIFIGIFLGLIINLVWVTIVLGSLPRLGTAEATIEAGFLHQVPANVPMSFLLHSRLFLVSGFVFAILSVTASYMANGTGLHGFVRDLSNTYLRSDNAWLIAALAFVPPLVIALLCPDIFLGALDIVGGVGESTLFVLLPGIILLHFSRGRSRALFAAGLVMVAVGGLTTIYVLAEKAGLVDLASFPGA